MSCRSSSTLPPVRASCQENMGRTGVPSAATGQATDRWAEKPMDAIRRGSMPDRPTAARQASMVFGDQQLRILLDPARPRIAGPVIAVVARHRVPCRSKIRHRAPVVPTSTPAR